MSGVRSVNPFAILAEDGEQPRIAPSKPQPQVDQPKPAQQSSQSKPRQQNSKPRSSQRGGRDQGRDDSLPSERAPRGERGSKRGRGNGRIPGNAGGRRKGRQFDRQSQTGRTESNKQNSAWGGEDGKKELANEEAANKDASKEGQETVPGTPDERQEPQETTKTLDEYLAERASKKLELNGDQQVRKANEGAEEFTGAQLLRENKQQEEEYFIAPKQTNKEPKAKSHKASKVTIAIDGTFAKPESERRPRNTNARRGGSRGRGGFRGGRGGRQSNNTQRQPKVNINDETAFPTLA